MGFLDIDFSDVQEPSAVPGDQEYKLRIVGVKTDENGNLPTNKNGQEYLLPRFEIVGEPTAKEFTRYIGMPDSSMDAKQLNNAKWALKSFFEAFDLDPNNVTIDGMVGAEGWAILGLEETNEWGEQNFVKKFIAPK